MDNQAKDRIATYYSNAREFVKQNNPKAASAYVRAILNNALVTYQSATSILTKAKTQVFMDQWIAVYRDLHDKGITDFVLESFGLLQKREPELPKPPKKAAKPVPPDVRPEPKAKAQPKPKSGGDKPAEELPLPNLDGLLPQDTQGWCAEVFEKTKTAVVEISVSAKTRGASGTGFIISKNGYLLTNDHVVYDDTARAYYPNAKFSFAGTRKNYKMEVLFSDKRADVALCRFDPTEVGDFSVVKRLDDYSRLLQGADCLVIGNAFGMGLAPFTGVVRFTKNDSGDLVYTAPSNPGDSGGPVLNRQGDCIGINKSKTVAVNNVTADGYANATPMDRINELLKFWCEANKIVL